MLLGDCPDEAIDTFLTECFHSDHGLTETDVVILRNCEPTEGIERIIKSPEFDQKVIFVKGNPIEYEDLERCDAHKAACCVVMSNQWAANSQQDDYMNILSSFAVKKYTSHLAAEENEKQKHNGIRICLQLSKPEHRNLYYSGQNNSRLTDQVLCVEELKL